MDLRLANIADALTEHSPNSFRLISSLFALGKLHLPRHDPYALESSEWKWNNEANSIHCTIKMIPQIEEVRSDTVHKLR